MVIRHSRFGIVLTVAAILGLVLTSVVTANPTRTSAQAPSTSSPVSSTVSTPAEAADVAHPTQDAPADRPSIAASPKATTAPTEAPTPEPAPAIELVTLAPMTVDVWNADERYFAVSGTTPDEIVASAIANVPADPSGSDRHEMAYAGPITWDHRPSYVQDASGSCTMTAIVSTVAYQATLPQWTAPANVPQELLDWWLIVLEHIRVHESQHIRIFQDHVAALPARIVGQPCSAWDGIIAQWSSEVLAAQTAFDAAESHWPFPTYAGPLDW